MMAEYQYNVVSSNAETPKPYNLRKEQKNVHVSMNNLQHEQCSIKVHKNMKNQLT